MNLPNKLTMMRIFMIPIFIACFYIPFKERYAIATLVFVLAYATDAIDGWYARKYNMVTDFGKLMDPMADKLLSISAMILMLACGLLPSALNNSLSAILVAVTICREFALSGVRIIGAKKGIVIAASSMGKVKTMVQFISLTFMMLTPFYMIEPLRVTVGSILVIAMLIPTIWSLVEYIVINKSVFAD